MRYAALIAIVFLTSCGSQTISDGPIFTPYEIPQPQVPARAPSIQCDTTDTFGGSRTVCR